MKTLALTSILFLVSCGPTKVQIVPNEVELQQLQTVLNNQGQAIQQLIKILQDAKLIKEPEVKKE